MLKSASKLTLLSFALAIIVGLFMGKIGEDNFMNVVMLVFTYYFVKRVEKKEDGEV